MSIPVTFFLTPCFLDHWNYSPVKSFCQAIWCWVVCYRQWYSTGLFHFCYLTNSFECVALKRIIWYLCTGIWLIIYHFWLTAIWIFLWWWLQWNSWLKEHLHKSKFIFFILPSLSKRFERWAMMVSLELLSFTRWSMRKFNSCFEAVLGCCWLQRETDCSFFL